MFSRMKFLIFFIIISLITASFFSCAHAPDVTEFTRTPNDSSSPSPAQSTPIAQTTTASLTVSTQSSPPDITTPGSDQPIKPEFPLEKNPQLPPSFDKEKNGFSCYFADYYIYSFENGNKCSLKISAGGVIDSASATVDLSVGNADFNEEGIFSGVGFVTDYRFEPGVYYTIDVTVETALYIYTFSFSILI